MSRARRYFFVILTVLSGTLMLNMWSFTIKRGGIFGGGRQQVLTKKTLTQGEVDRLQAGDNLSRVNDRFSKFCRELWNDKEVVKMERDKEELGKGCSCEDDTYGTINNASLGRRKEEFRRWKKRQDLEREPVVYSKALSPLGYPGGGVVVEPNGTVLIAPLYLHPVAVECLYHSKSESNRHGDTNKLVIRFTSAGALGRVFLALRPHQLPTSAEVLGNDTDNLRIGLPVTTQATYPPRAESDADVFNSLLSHIHYRSVRYDILRRDVVRMSMENFTSEINILIKRPVMPILYDTGPDDDIASKVTIITKTFERPPCVQNLVDSVRKYYPNVTIVIADDSENHTRVYGDNVKYYTMPFAEGWFAGRNLALSQVRTKYFLWVDDDFEFTERTDLQKFVDKLEDEEEGLDIVAGAFENRRGKTIINTNIFKTMTVSQGDENGSCLVRNRGFHRKMKNYPQCIRSDVVINFFMAKTLSVRRIGFDPYYMRVGHTEFFVDGLGQLSVALCFDVTVKHARYKPERYLFYRRRRDDPDDTYNNVQHSLFKNNMHCFELH